MWLNRLKELKKEKGITTQQISAKTGLPEKTISRILSGETDNPYVDTLQRIVTALGCSLDDIFADTNVVVATETFAEVKENANVAEAELVVITQENNSLKAEITALTHEIELLQKEIQHKDELIKHKDEILDWHRFYNNRK
jgi:transcriptional regulator with XRE-family HTH domain